MARRCAKMAPGWPQAGPKIAPRWPEMAPRWSRILGDVMEQLFLDFWLLSWRRSRATNCCFALGVVVAPWLQDGTHLNIHTVCNDFEDHPTTTTTTTTYYWLGSTYSYLYSYSQPLQQLQQQRVLQHPRLQQPRQLQLQLQLLLLRLLLLLLQYTAKRAS